MNWWKTWVAQQCNINTSPTYLCSYRLHAVWSQLHMDTGNCHRHSGRRYVPSRDCSHIHWHLRCSRHLSILSCSHTHQSRDCMTLYFLPCMCSLIGNFYQTFQMCTLKQAMQKVDFASKNKTREQAPTLSIQRYANNSDCTKRVGIWLKPSSIPVYSACKYSRWWCLKIKTMSFVFHVHCVTEAHQGTKVR